MLELSGGEAVRLDDWLGPGDRPCGHEYRVVLRLSTPLDCCAARG
jgi:hypothetical protein